MTPNQGSDVRMAAADVVHVPAGSPSAPYSSAVRVGDLVWTSGQLPIQADGSVPTGMRAQTDVALSNLAAVLKAAGASPSTVVKVNAYVTDIEQLPVFNEVYCRWFPQGSAPARTTVQVAAFRGETLVEIEAVAHAPSATPAQN